MANSSQNDVPIHLPLSEISDKESPEIKPSWRGWIHTGVLPLAIAGGIVLLVCLLYTSDAADE